MNGRRRFSARLRLTALYTSLFAACGGLLVAVTFLLVAHSLPNRSVATVDTSSAKVQAAIEQCVANAAQTGKGGNGDAKTQCTDLYAKGVQTGSSTQRSNTLDHLLIYSIITLCGVTVLASVAGWVVAGRILRPVHQLTAAARTASEQNLSQRLALQGPRDELRELADTFDDMLERLGRAFTSQRQFIANASHELRTPLTVMRTAIDVVLTKPNPTPDELRSMSLDVRAGIDAAERLIEALLTLARNEQSKTPSEPLDLATVAEDALDDHAPAGLTTLATLNAAPVTGDPVLLQRLVGNLLDNAAQYNVPGGSIAITTTTENGVSVLRVVNTGALVAHTDVERLFLPFTRQDDRTRHNGSGLGLALVRSIATLHGGTVQARAVPTGGLDIEVRIPTRT